MTEVRVWTTGVAHWGDLTVYIDDWAYGGKEVSYLQKLFPDCVIRVDHYDPYMSDRTCLSDLTNPSCPLFYTTDRVTSRYHGTALDPSILPVDSIVYDYAHILNPITRVNGLRYITQHHYSDYPITYNDNLQLKVVYHGYTGIKEPSMLLRRNSNGIVCTLYDMLYHEGILMDGTVSLKGLLPPLYRDKQREGQRLLRDRMSPGPARLEAMDRSDEEIFRSVLDMLWKNIS